MIRKGIIKSYPTKKKIPVKKSNVLGFYMGWGRKNRNYSLANLFWIYASYWEQRN